MTQEFEGKSEIEAISNALTTLGLTRDEIEVEIVDLKRPLFLFGQGKVRIRVQYGDRSINTIVNNNEKKENGTMFPIAGEEWEEKIVQFVDDLIQHMGITGKARIVSSGNNKLILDIKSKYSNLIIGKKGKTLDSIQLLANIYVGRIGPTKGVKVIIDIEDYRVRREKQLISYAYKIADQVRRTRSSILLNPMNPFERRLIHTTLNNSKDLETISEGEGLYKKIRVLYKTK
jgi:spoIIIJ-associated protein